MSQKTYHVKLYYGYQTLEDGETYHALEAVDPEKKVNEKRMEKALAEALDTTRHDDQFDYGSMLVQLPNSVVNRIRDDAIKEYLAHLARRKRGIG